MTLRAIQAAPAQRLPVGDPAWMVPFLDSLAREDLAPATLRGYRYDLRHFLAWHATVQPDAFALDRLAEFELIAYRQHMIFFANQGDFRTGDYEEIMNKASCLSLLSNAVLIWNTVHISRITGQLRAAGHLVGDEDLARVSPLAHAHTIPSGTYFQSPRRRADIAPEPVMA